jgi:NADH dehydrogenase/NADH:ubiquinone oxidoreductase subunit G
MVQLTIDDKSVHVPPGYTLLQAARENGIHIPTLCYHEALLPYGACRLCMVELIGPRGSRLAASCAYPCEDGLVVRTGSELVIGARQAIVELLMSTAGHLPVVRKLAQELGVEAPFVALEQDDCILCGLCVRVCREIVGVGAISLTNRGMDRQVSTPFQISSADCIECATCALVCPTGAIRIEHITRPARTSHTWASAYARRACRLCEYDPPGPPFPQDYREFLGTQINADEH